MKYRPHTAKEEYLERSRFRGGYFDTWFVRVSTYLCPVSSKLMKSATHSSYCTLYWMWQPYRITIAAREDALRKAISENTFFGRQPFDDICWATSVVASCSSMVANFPSTHGILFDQIMHQTDAKFHVSSVSLRPITSCWAWIPSILDIKSQAPRRSGLFYIWSMNSSIVVTWS